MSPIFIVGTILLLALMYWGAYANGKEIKTIELSGNVLLTFPEFIFKLILLGLCMGLASTLTPTKGRAETYLGWPSANPALDVVIGAAVGIALQFIVNVLSTTAIRIWGSSIYSSLVIKSIIPKNVKEWILLPIPLLLGVIVEEVLFRALAIGGFSALLPGVPWFAWLLAVVSSVLFGLVHRPQGILGMILVGLVGFIFAAIFIVSGSLVMVISTHFVINLLQLIRAREDLAWLERFKQREQLRQEQPAVAASSANVEE